MAIFISYSSRDHERTEQLAKILSNFDKSIYFEAKMLGGNVSWTQIFNSIKNCDLFIYVLTAHSANSYARKLELDYAATLNRRILSIMFEEVSPLPDDIAATKLVYYREKNDDPIKLLGDAIAELPAPQPLPSSMPFAPDWVGALLNLQQRSETKNLPLYEQRRIATNLRDFLERRETYAPAVSLLRLLLSQRPSDSVVIEEFNYLSEDIAELTNHRRRKRAISLIVPIAVVATVLTILVTQVLPSTFPTNDSQSPIPPSATGLAMAASSTSITSVTAPAVSKDTMTALPLAETALTSSDASSTAISVATTIVPAIPPTTTLTATQAPTSLPTATPTITTTASITPTRTPVPSVAVYVGIHVEDDRGRVRVVERHTTAQLAGVEIGDFVTAVDGAPISTAAEFQSAMNMRRPLGTVELRLGRDGALVLASITLSISDFALPEFTATPTVTATP